MKVLKFFFLIVFAFVPFLMFGQLQVSTGLQGIETISYGGVQLLNTASQKGSDLTTEGYLYTSKDGLLKSGWSQQLSKSLDAKTGYYTGIFNWGKLRYRYTGVRDTLKISLQITNTSKTDTLYGVNIYPVHLSFPQRPSGFQPLQFYFHYNLDAPTVFPIDYGTGKMVVCNEDVKAPVFVGLLDKNGSSGGDYKIWISNIGFNGLSELAPVIYKKLPPGKSVTYKLSLRFGNPSSNVFGLATDILEKYRKQWPQKLAWSDRRPIGTLILSSVENKSNTSNPRGWLPNTRVNVSSAAGRMDFRSKILSYADQSIAILKQMNAQGMITWDIEGQEFPHPLSYVGSPEELNNIAPEMTDVADTYFKKFRDAGLKVGVCIRPDSVAFSPMKKTLARIQRNQLNQLKKKIKYAMKRWGCTLFYIDSNGDPNYPLSADVFEKLNVLFPGVLLIPEHQNSRYYAYSAPYEEMRGGVDLLPEITRLTYPQGFMVLNVAEGLRPGSEPSTSIDKLKNAVKQGNILLFRSWYQDEPTNGFVIMRD